MAPSSITSATLGFIAALLGVGMTARSVDKATGTATTRIGGTSTVAVLKRAR